MKPAAQLIAEIRGGLPARHADQLVTDAINAARSSGKKATVTLTLTFEPHGRENREIHVALKSKATLPAAPDLEEKSIYFVSHKGLTRDDPEQGNLPGVRAVDDHGATGTDG